MRWKDWMIDFNASVSATPQECQIVTELPAGGGDNGGLGGSSVGVMSGVPAVGVDADGDGETDSEGTTEPPGVRVGVEDLDGVLVGLGVEVAGPG
jgi:hypothetical protein